MSNTLGNAAGLLRCIAAACVLLLVVSAPAGAFDPPAEWDGGVQAQQVMDSLAEVAKKFGPHAVILQTALLNEAVRNGSILEAAVEAPSYQQRDGKQYVAFVLESGIVYNDNSVSAEERARRTWKEIVASALHRLTDLDIKAQGLAVSVGYHHRPYDNERDLREQLPDSRGEAETMSYFMGIDDAVGLAKGTADADAVLQRAVVLRSGAQIDLK